MTVSFTSTGITFNDSSSQTTRAVTAFPASSVALFKQNTAPTGWTKSATHNDKALRVVSGSITSGGATAFSSVMVVQTSGSTALSLSTIPNHRHGSVGNIYAASPGFSGGSWTYNYGYTMGSTGSSGSHNHTLTMDVQYVDLIVATKD